MKIRIENLNKIYPGGKKALNNLNLTIEPGMFGLLGPNGAGKTSLMRIMTLLQSATSGTIFLTIMTLRKTGRRFVPCWDICRRISVFLRS